MYLIAISIVLNILTERIDHKKLSTIDVGIGLSIALVELIVFYYELNQKTTKLVSPYSIQRSLNTNTSNVIFFFSLTNFMVVVLKKYSKSTETSTISQSMGLLVGLLILNPILVDYHSMSLSV